MYTSLQFSRITAEEQVRVGRVTENGFHCLLQVAVPEVRNPPTSWPTLLLPCPQGSNILSETEEQWVAAQEHSIALVPLDAVNQQHPTQYQAPSPWSRALHKGAHACVCVCVSIVCVRFGAEGTGRRGCCTEVGLGLPHRCT